VWATLIFVLKELDVDEHFILFSLNDVRWYCFISCKMLIKSLQKKSRETLSLEPALFPTQLKN
jgi:hypothetical protein